MRKRPSPLLCRGRSHCSVGAPPWCWARVRRVTRASDTADPGSGAGTTYLGLASVALAAGLRPTAVAGRVHPEGQVDRLRLCPGPGVPHGLLEGVVVDVDAGRVHCALLGADEKRLSNNPIVL